MAATNFTPIQIYFSTTASAVPLAANLAQGELAINITDGKLYYEDNAGVVQVIATKGAGTIGGSNTQIQYNNAGALAGNAAMTFNSATSTTTLTTLNLTNALGATFGGTAQSSYTQGDILYSSATNTLAKLGIGTVNFILTSTGSVPQWVAPTSITVQTANNLAGGAAGSVPYQSAVDTTTFLAIGAANRVMTSTGSAPQWVTSLTSLTGVSSSSITNTSLTSGRVVFSGASGVQTDSANLTFNGTTLSATGFSTTGLSTLVQTVTIGNSNFNGAAVFAPTTPAKLYIGTGTVTDTTSAIGATNATGAISSLAITPIAATNTTVTYTNAATLYIAGAPSAGTNITITNPYSLYVAAGTSYFGGAVDVAGNATFGSLGAGRVVYTSTGGLLASSSNLTYAGTDLANSNGDIIIGNNPSVTTRMFRAIEVGASGNNAGIAFGNTGGKGAIYGQSGSANLSIVSGNSGAIAFGYSTGNADASANFLSLGAWTTTGLGIGTATPGVKVDIVSANNTSLASVLRVNSNNVAVSTSIAYDGLVGSGEFELRTSSASALKFGTNATERARIDSSGNLIVGGTSPTGRLTVADSTTSVLTLRATSAVDADGRVIGTLNFQEPEGTGDGTLAIEAAISGLRSGTDSFNSGGRLAFYTRPFNGALTQAMTLDASGNLGVGVTSPLSRIDARAASATIDNYQQIQAITTNSAAINLGGGIGLGGYYSGTAAVAIFGNVTGRKENATDGNFSGYLAFGTNNNSTGIVERARIDSSGNMGIGTTTPSSRLEIVGVNPKLTINANDIVNGRTATLSLISGTSADPTSLCQIMYGASNSTTAGTLVFVEGDGTTQRMRITPAGEVVINNTVAYNSARLAVAGDLEARGSMKSYQSTRGGLAIGASVDLFSIPAGSFGTGISMIAYVEQRDDNIGALSNYQFSITGWGGSGVTVNVASNQGYGAGSPLTVSTGTSGGSAFVTLTNASGRTSTSLTMVVIVLLSYPSITWGW